MAIKKLMIEVAYAEPNKQSIIKIEIDEGCTVQSAIEQSGILNIFPQIDLSKQKVGMFSKACHLHDKVNQTTRIEIYRPLAIDPKEARKAKAKMLANQRSK